MGQGKTGNPRTTSEGGKGKAGQFCRTEIGGTTAHEGDITEGALVAVSRSRSKYLL
jgi:hypothetical protein